MSAVNDIDFFKFFMQNYQNNLGYISWSMHRPTETYGWIMYFLHKDTTIMTIQMGKNIVVNTGLPGHFFVIDCNEWQKMMNFYDENPSSLHALSLECEIDSESLYDALSECAYIIDREFSEETLEMVTELQDTSIPYKLRQLMHEHNTTNHKIYSDSDIDSDFLSDNCNNIVNRIFKSMPITRYQKFLDIKFKEKNKKFPNLAENQFLLMCAKHWDKYKKLIEFIYQHVNN